MTLPNFLVIGAYKAGTTSLHRYLQQHPQVAMSRIKETRFLTYAGREEHPLSPLELRAAPWPVRTIGAYQRQFASASAAHVARGEASPSYMAFPRQSIAGIRRHVPEAKLIAILRQPAERAYSSFVGLVRAGREEVLDFARAVQLERESRPRRNDRGPRRNLLEGFYFSQLRWYLEAFPTDQIMVFLYEELQRHPDDFMRRISAFLGIDSTVAFDTSRRHNQAAWPRNRLFHNLLHHPLCPLPGRVKLRLSLPNLTSAPPLDPEMRRHLTQEYRSDILQLQSLIGRDLSHWLDDS